MNIDLCIPYPPWLLETWSLAVLSEWAQAYISWAEYTGWPCNCSLRRLLDLLVCTKFNTEKNVFICIFGVSSEWSLVLTAWWEYAQGSPVVCIYIYIIWYIYKPFIWQNFKDIVLHTYSSICSITKMIMNNCKNNYSHFNTEYIFRKYIREYICSKCNSSLSI